MTMCNEIPPHISIHSPYAGRDWISLSFFCAKRISIHSPYAGRDKVAFMVTVLTLKFQSTLPMQGETAKTNNILLFQLDILHRKISYILFSEDISSVYHK